MDESEKENRCPLCTNDEIMGAFCPDHLKALKDYDWIKDYINNLSTVDNKTVHILTDAISDRLSYVINDLDIINGRIQIEEYLEEKVERKLNNGKEVKCTVWKERILREILAMRRAKSIVLSEINSMRQKY